MKFMTSLGRATALRARAAERSNLLSTDVNTRTYLGLFWAFILGALVAGLYLRIASLSLWVSLITLPALLALAPKTLQMRAVDWSVLLIAAFEVAILPLHERRPGKVALPHK